VHIYSTLKEFLYDKDYFIAYYQNKIYIYNCDNIILLSKTKILIELQDKKITILGNDLSLCKSLNKEILITGIFKGLLYE